MTTDEMYMYRCLQLARMGRPTVSPNPMVGAVVVCDARVIGEGYHHHSGAPHAEVNAIASVSSPELLTRSTLYVSLEPCSHFGKTPPCANLIIEKKIPRVVVGCLDSNRRVDGKGVARLRDAGVEVTVGVLEEECRLLNRRFFTVQENCRPYVVLKWAQSKDGFIDKNREAQERPVTFSTPATGMLVHRLRAMSDAILVGTRTALLDNPSLTVRNWRGCSPVRIVLDRERSLPAHLKLFTDGAPTRLVTSLDAPSFTGSAAVEQLRFPFDESLLPSLLARLGEEKVQCLLVEGGGYTLQRFIDSALWDEARIEIAPLRLGGGVKAPRLPVCTMRDVKTCFGHTLFTFER